MKNSTSVGKSGVDSQTGKSFFIPDADKVREKVPLALEAQQVVSLIQLLFMQDYHRV